MKDGIFIRQEVSDKNVCMYVCIYFIIIFSLEKENN